MTVCRW